MEPLRPKRGPYRRYLCDLNAPIPKTTRWRLKNNEKLKTNETSLLIVRDHLEDKREQEEAGLSHEQIVDEESVDELTEVGEVEIDDSDIGDMEEPEDDIDDQGDIGDMEEPEDDIDDQGDIGDMEEPEDDIDDQDDIDDMEEPEDDIDDQGDIGDMEEPDCTEDEIDFVEELEDDVDDQGDIGDREQEDESDDEDPEIDEKMFEPIYEGARITVCGAYCAIMELKRACRLPFTAIAMLLQILQLLCPADNKLPRTVYILKRFFQKYSSKSTKMRFCGSCNRKFTSSQRKCSNLDCQSEPSTLIILRPDKAIRRVLTRNQVTLNYPQPDRNNIFYDIHSGKGFQTRHPEQFGIFFNTDGISPFKSSRLTIWPIYLAFANLPPSVRTNKANLVTCAFWVGQNKPPMEIFLQPLKVLLSRLEKTGVALSSTRTVRFRPLFGVLDLIAKAPALNMMQFNGMNGCPVCLHPGIWEGTRLYLPGSEYSLRTNESIVQDAGEAERDQEIVNGIKGHSILSGVVNLATGLPTDYMHCVLEGVMKKLLEVWMKGHTLGCYIGRRLNEIDPQLLKQCPPHDFTRAPRSIKNHRKYWKASEFRNFLLYYSLPLLVCVLPPLYFHHFGLLVCAMHILLQNQISNTQIQAAQNMLDDFYLLLPELYGNQICVMNMHLLSHMANFVQLWGPLWTHSAFGFESMNGHITGMIHSCYNIAEQLLFSIDVATTMSILADKLKSVEDEETLTILSNTQGIPRKNMLLLFPGTYSIGLLHSYTPTADERQALNRLTRVRVNRTLLFHRLFTNGTILHSIQYGRPGGKRDSTICSFRSGGSQLFGVIQKFCLCECAPVNVVFIKPFHMTNKSILSTSGNPGRDILSQYAEVDLLSSFIIQVKKQLLPLVAVPIADILNKCVKVSGKDYDYIVKIPNNYEHH